MEIDMLTRRSPIYVTFLALFLLLMSCTQVTGDVEPNDTKETAENINLGQAILGSLDWVSDIHDFHNITLEGEVSIVAVLDGPAGADFDLGIYDSEGFQLAGDELDMDADEVLVYIPPTNGSYFIDVFAFEGSGSYTLDVKKPQQAPNTTYDLREAISKGYIIVTLYGAYRGSSESFDLETGENVFFGLCVDIEIMSIVTNDLEIIIPHGLLLFADNPAVENKVITSRHVIRVEALSKTTQRLYAMSTDIDKKVPDFGSSFQAGGMVEGDLKKVVHQINATNNQGAAGQIAVWMVTDSAERKTLERYGASDSEIKEALDILDNAGVEPPFTDEESSGLITCLGLVAVMIALIVVIGFISFKFKDKPRSSQEEEDVLDGEETPP